MKITNPITLDVARSNSYICLLGKQFDSNSRYLQVTLTNNGQPLPIPSGAGVVLRATRADGAGSMTAGTVNGDGTALVEIDETLLEVAGAASLSIEVTSGGQVLTSASCNLTVQKADASGWVKVYVAAASVSAGTYYISLAGQSYSFTTTQTIPAGGAIYFNSDGGTAQTRDASGNVLDASLTLTAGTSGTELTSDVPTMTFLAALAQQVGQLADTDNAVAGSAEALLGGPAQDDAVYTIRASANTARKALRAIKGVTMGWIQLIRNGNFATTDNWTGYGGTITVSNNVGTLTLNSPGGANRIEQLNIATISGHKYLISFYASTSAAVSANLLLESTTIAVLTYGTTKTLYGVIFTAASTGSQCLRFYCNGSALGNGGTFSLSKVTLYDMTINAGSAIADHAATLESGTPGAGVAWLADNFPELTSKYHAYAPGSLQSTKVNASKAIGFNIWDETWRFDAGQVKALNLIRVLPNETYYFKCPVALFAAYKYDSAGQSLGTIAIGNNSTFTTDAQTHFIWFSVDGSVYGSTYKGDICINLSNPLLNGTYRPHAEHSYPIQPVELRGVLSLDANNKVITTGDEYKSDGTITRGRGRITINLASLSYIQEAGANGQWYSDTKPFENLAKLPASNNDFSGGICDKLAFYIYSELNTKVGIGITSTGRIGISDAVKNEISNYGSVIIEYPLATPTTENATPFTELQRVDDGIEEFVDAEVEAGTRDVVVPVGQDATIYRDLAALLGAIPNPPTSAGTYTLRATVTTTNATFSWS